MPHRLKDAIRRRKKSCKILICNINKSLQSYLSNTFVMTLEMSMNQYRFFCNCEKINNKSLTAIKSACHNLKIYDKTLKTHAYRIHILITVREADIPREQKIFKWKMTLLNKIKKSKFNQNVDGKHLRKP